MEEEFEDNEEKLDVETIEVSLDEEEIDEMIQKLEVLKETKESAMIDLAADLDLVVHYDGGNGE